MKKLFVYLFIAAVSVCSLNAQEQLEPTTLGKWKKPAATGVSAIDNYVNHCAGMYEETMNLRKQYEEISALTLDASQATEGSENGQNVVKSKVAEYEALAKRAEGQQTEAEKIPGLVEAATKAIPLGLKAISATKAITATKEAISLAVKENAALLKAITSQITTLSAAPVKATEEE